MTMQDDEIVLSPAKKQELEAELEQLQTVGRREIADRIKDARSLGDLSENFDYHDAKRQQGFLEGRINNLKQMLERARVVESAGGGDTVALGSRVTVRDEDGDDTEYTIVGVMEADATQNRISNTSPMAKSLMGHRVGDTVDVQAPGGTIRFEIVSVA
jgi:transcription elongation factor GreA